MDCNPRKILNHPLLQSNKSGFFSDVYAFSSKTRNDSKSFSMNERNVDSE